MEIKFSKSIQIYFTSVITLLFIGIASGMAYYWHTGAINTDNIGAIYEASVSIEDLGAKESLDKIQYLANADRAKEAIKYVTNLESSIEKIEDVSPVPGSEYDSLQKNFTKVKNSITNLIAVPEVKNLIRIFAARVADYNKFVSDNNWRTLTRISEITKSRVERGRFETPESYSYMRLKGLKRAILADIRKMRSVTEASVLAPENKNIIYIKLKSLKTEVVMLDSYITALKSFNTNFSSLATSVNLWKKAVAPEIALNKLKFEKQSRGIVFGVAGLLLFLVLTILSSVPIFTRFQLSGQKEFEDKVVNVIRRGIIPFESQLTTANGSPEFQSEIHKFHDYVHKRMSFGSVFREAMPFSSVLLDSNLTMIWANSIFYETWGIDEAQTRTSSVTWNSLQKSTNLGEEDPVLLAHNEGLAGIYQIQVKTEKDKESSPYEMYVSPVEYAGQNRIMVMFYPLRTIEDTIMYQTKAVIGPIAKTIEALNTQSYDEEFRERISSDYSAAGIENILEGFDEYNESILATKDSYGKEIDSLELQLMDQHKLNNDLKKSIAKQGMLQQDLVESLKQTKKSIIDMIELRGKMEEKYLATMEIVNSLFYDQEQLLKDIKVTTNILGEQSGTFKKLSALRNDYREIKKDIEQFKISMSQSLSRITINDSDDSNLQDYVQYFKDDMSKFDSCLVMLNQVLTQSDVSLSKLEIIMSQDKAPDLEPFVNNYSWTKEQIESSLNEMNIISLESSEIEDILVSSLKEQFQAYKDTNSNLRMMNELIENDENEELPEVPELDSTPEIHA